MSKIYKYYWYGPTKTFIKEYKVLSQKQIRNEIEQRYVNAIQDAIIETESKKYGKERLETIRLLYFDKTLNVDGVAMRLFRTRKQIQVYISDFVYLVAKKAGFDKNGDI